MGLIVEAARALAEYQSGNADWDRLSPIRREQFIGAVNAALRVLRDPDERMIEAGLEIIRTVRPGESEAAYMNDAANTWRFMVDGLLQGDK